MGPLQLCRTNTIKKLPTYLREYHKSEDNMDLRNGSSQDEQHNHTVDRETVVMPRVQDYRTVIASGSQHVAALPIAITSKWEQGSEQYNAHTSQSHKRKKPPQPTPDDRKDEVYWERRKRNNESAKRSREQRRHKEKQTTMRVTQLEQENLTLRTEVGLLREEVARLRQILYTKGASMAESSS